MACTAENIYCVLLRKSLLTPVLGKSRKLLPAKKVPAGNPKSKYMSDVYKACWATPIPFWGQTASFQHIIVTQKLHPTHSHSKHQDFPQVRHQALGSICVFISCLTCYHFKISFLPLCHWWSFGVLCPNPIVPTSPVFLLLDFVPCGNF